MKLSLTTAVALSAVALLTALVSPHSALVLVWWGTLVALVYRVSLGSSDVGPVLRVFAFYSLLAVVLYKTQLWTNPAYYGFSGGNGVGTDDSFFYSLAAYDLPFDFPRRFAIAAQRHNYADLLKVLLAVHRRIFPSLHPLDLLFFNTAVLSFLPFATRELHRSVFPGDRGDRWAWGMALVAPFILANGVILMRDGLVATVFVGGLVTALRRRWLSFLLLLAATSWLRVQSGVMLGVMAVTMVLTWRELDETRADWRRAGSGLRLILTGSGLLLLVLVAVQVTLRPDWFGLAFRGDFLRSTIGVSAKVDTGTSTFYALSQLPVFLRLPLSLLFYIGSPFLALASLKTHGLWIPRAFLTNVFALLFPLYAAWFYRGLMRVVRERHRGALVLVLLFVVSMSLVTQASMQMRHKIPLQPIFYILAAYGVTSPFGQDRSLGWFIALTVVAMDIVFNILPLVAG